MLHARMEMANDRGFTMAVVLPLLLVLLAFAATTLQMTRSGVHFTALNGARQRSFYIAEGGLQNAMTRLYADHLTASTSFSYTAYKSDDLGGGSFTYTIVQDPMFLLDPTRKQVTATGTIAGTTSTVVSQVQVYPFVAPPGGGKPTCDWLMFANRGAAELINASGVATDLLNGNVHSNNELHVTAQTGAGIHGSGRFESVNRTIATATVGGILSNMNATLFRGGDWVVSGAAADVHNALTGYPIAGIHFANVPPMDHGAQQTVSTVGYPHPDWKAWEQFPGMIIVDKDHVPFGSWDDDTSTWTARTRIFPNDDSAKYYVRGSVNLQGITLARSTNAFVVAEGAIEVDQLSLLQTGAGGVLGIALNSTQTLRLIGKKNVYIGRGFLQSAPDALGDATRPGLNLSAAVVVSNQIGAYSETGDVWVKSSAIAVTAATQLNLVGDVNSTFAVTGSLASTPTAFCQPVSPI